MKKYLFALAMTAITGSSFAEGLPNYWSGHLSAGLGWSSLSNSDLVNAGSPFFGNLYTNSHSSVAQPIFGLGVSYNMPYQDVTLGLGVSAYYMNNTTVSGTFSPEYSYGGYSVPYTASGQSYALMLEPKFTWSQYALQPYAFVGAGLGINDFGNFLFGEAPSGSPAPGNTPGTYDEYNLAYEMGFGVQYVFQNAHAPIIGLEYRYMNWGRAGMAAPSDQLSGDGIDFGNLKTSSINLNLTVPF